MDRLSTQNEQEPFSEVVVTAPAAELLQTARLAAETWPEQSAHDSAFLHQIEQHEKNIRSIHDVLEHQPQPDVSLEQAVGSGLLTEVQVTELYQSLSSLLIDQDYNRLALYLPFEFMPGSAWVPEDAALQAAIDEFRQSYRASWYALLSVHDARANFVDGDVLEVHMREDDLPRAVKAAHLIPKLIETDMLSSEEIIDLLEIAEEPQLQADITAGLLVSDDLGWLTDSDVQRLTVSLNEPSRSAASTMLSSRTVEKPQEVPVTSEYILAKLELITKAGDFDKTGMTVRRADWLEQQKRDRAIADLAEEVGLAVLDGSIPPETLRSFLIRSNLEVAAPTFIETVRRIVEQASLDGRNDTQQLFDSFRDDLLGLSYTTPNISERVAKLYRRLYRLGVVAETELSALDISLPTLAGPFSDNLEMIPDEVSRIREIAQSIDDDPDLSNLIYPVITVGGSRLKGYGEENSDIDLGIFIKPEVADDTRQLVRQMVRAKFGHDDDPIEFWLDEAGNGLKVRDMADGDGYVADGYWTHMLFGTAWIGKQESLQELQRKLLPDYFTDSGSGKDGRTDRQLHLERLEQDLLQYRLLHKGYERHYPARNRLNSQHAHLIDGDSTFWDPGYRRIATKLFVDAVFLPKIV